MASKKTHLSEAQDDAEDTSLRKAELALMTAVEKNDWPAAELALQEVKKAGQMYFPLLEKQFTRCKKYPWMATHKAKLSKLLFPEY